MGYRLSFAAQHRSMVSTFGGVIVTRIAATGTGYAFMLLVMAQLGATEAGVFFTCQGVVITLAALARGGLDNVALRRISVAPSSEQGAELLLAIFCLGLLSAIQVPVLLVFAASESYQSLAISHHLNGVELSVLVPLLSFVSLMPFILQGFGHASLSLATTTFFPFLGAAPFLFVITDSGKDLFVVFAAVSSLVALLSVIGVARPAGRCVRCPRWSEVKACLREMGSLYGVSLYSVALMWFPNMLMLEFGDPAGVATLNFALRTAALLQSILIVVNSVMSRRFAIMWSQGEVVEVRVRYLFITRILALVALVAFAAALVAAMLLPDTLLGMETGWTEIFLVVVAAQAINLASGPAMNLLIMAEQRRYVKRASLAGLMAAIVAPIGCALAYGANGVAYGFLAAMAFVNLFGLLGVRKAFRGH